MSEARKEAVKEVGRLDLPKEAVTSGRLDRLAKSVLAAEPEATQAALKQY